MLLGNCLLNLKNTVHVFTLLPIVNVFKSRDCWVKLSGFFLKILVSYFLKPLNTKIILLPDVLSYNNITHRLLLTAGFTTHWNYWLSFFFNFSVTLQCWLARCSVCLASIIASSRHWSGCVVADRSLVYQQRKKWPVSSGALNVRYRAVFFSMPWTSLITWWPIVRFRGVNFGC